MALQTRDEFLADLESRVPCDLGNVEEECPICYEVLRSPVKTECGHLLCIECARLWFESAHTCPSCRHMLYDKPQLDDNDDAASEWTAEEYALWDRAVPRPPLLTVFADVADSADPGHPSSWNILELLDPEEFEFDAEDDVFRETLVDLCNERDPGQGPDDVYADQGYLDEEEQNRTEGARMDRFWAEQPDWNGPAIVTRVHLQSQAKAAFVRLTPERHFLELGGTATREALCWDQWAALGRYLQRKLFHLCKHHPELSARALKDALSAGWQQHLQDEGLATPQFDDRLGYYFTWGPFDHNVDRLFTRVVLFAQNTARRYWKALERSRGPATEPPTEEEWVAACWANIDEEPTLYAFGEFGMNYEDMYRSREGRAFPVPTTPDPTQDLANNTAADEPEDGPEDILEPIICEINDLPIEKEALLADIILELKKHIITRCISHYREIAVDMVEWNTGCENGTQLYERLHAEPFPMTLCNTVHDLIIHWVRQTRRAREVRAREVEVQGGS